MGGFMDGVEEAFTYAELSLLYVIDECFRRKVNTLYYKTMKEGYEFSLKSNENDIKRLSSITPSNEAEESNIKMQLELSKNTKKANENTLSSVNKALSSKTELGENIWGKTNIFFREGKSSFGGLSYSTGEFYKQLVNFKSNCGGTSSNKKTQKVNQGTPTKNPTAAKNDISPFDKRLEYIMVANSGANNETMRIKRPFSSAEKTFYTQGHFFDISNSTINESGKSLPTETAQKILNDIEEAKADSFYYGTTALMNNYGLITLYGSNGGESLINMKGQRRWYELDTENNIGGINVTNYSTNPTTSTIVNWGQTDEHMRTPYKFADFVFCKWWNVIPNNRMITLRRFPGPILDNMNFPGMKGSNLPSDDKSKLNLPPMATAITFFGEETGNKLSDLLSFKTGFKWETAKAEIFKTNNQSDSADADNGPGGLFPSLTSIAKGLNIFGGSANMKAIRENQTIPPDPYEDGPYQNKILGPVNRIDEVAKRAPGLEFNMDGLKITFEYTARPVGGINPKAALLDILSNFMVMGSVTAMFWGGQHRFMGKSVKYPFLGGEKGMRDYYAGKPVSWATETMKSLGTDAGKGLSSLFSSFMDAARALLSGGDLSSAFGALMTDKSGKDTALNRILQGAVYSQNKSQVPYLTGMKSLLTGEPVGEWHVTIGNPLNPIAMIGNLILKDIQVTLGDELGPDDFPLDLKVVVTLDHGMARDRDAIMSMFNRGMGRTYSLPSNMHGSSEYTTRVDDATKKQLTSSGENHAVVFGTFASTTAVHGSVGAARIKPNALGVSQSIWSPTNFTSVNADQMYYDASKTTWENRVTFRQLPGNTNWVAQYSLSS